MQKISFNIKIWKKNEIITSPTNSLEKTKQIYQDYYKMINTIFGTEKGYQDITVFSDSNQCFPSIKILRNVNISSTENYSSEYEEICLNNSQTESKLPSRVELNFQIENKQFLQFPKNPDNQFSPFMQAVIHEMNKFSQTPGAYIRINSEIKFISDGTKWDIPKPTIESKSSNLIESKPSEIVLSTPYIKFYSMINSIFGTPKGSQEIRFIKNNDPKFTLKMIRHININPKENYISETNQIFRQGHELNLNFAFKNNEPLDVPKGNTLSEFMQAVLSDITDLAKIPGSQIYVNGNGGDFEFISNGTWWQKIDKSQPLLS